MTISRGGRNALILAGFALAHGLLLGYVYQELLPARYSGVKLYYDFASNVVGGKLPYRDFPLEYPPFALVFFVLPRLVASTLLGYYRWFQVEVIVFELAGLAILGLIAHQRNRSLVPPLAGYTIAIAAMGPITGQQFDIFPAILTLAALYCFWRERHATGWVLVALGALTKLFPLLVAPVWLFAYWNGDLDAANANIRLLKRSAAAFGITTVVVLLPWLVAPASLRFFVQYHAERGIQLESTYATLLLIAARLHMISMSTAMSFGSWNVTGGAATALTRLSTPLFLAALIGVVLRLRRYPPRRDATHGADIEWLAMGTLLVLVATLLTSKVFSPQYLLWLLPLIALVPAGSRAAVWATFALAGLATYYIFPMHYLELVRGNAAPEAALLVRNALIGLLAYLAARAVRALHASGEGARA